MRPKQILFYYSEYPAALLRGFAAARLTIFINLGAYKERARVHFISGLKVGVFVTLRAPDVIKYEYFSGYLGAPSDGFTQ
jgi:hypothetical protein